MSKTYDILSLGSIYFDINAIGFPFGDGLLSESETVGSQYLPALGGSAVICANVGASLGLKPVFLGKVGTDEFGQILERRLQESGITPHLITSSEVLTNVSMNYVNPEGKTLMTVVGTANQSLTKEEIFSKVEELLPQVSYLYMGGYFKLKVLTPHYPELIAMAKKHGVKLIMDHGRVNNTVGESELENLRHCISLVDLYFPSEEEFKAVWKVASVEEGLKAVREKTTALIIVKQSDKGAMGIDGNGSIVHVPAHPVTPINTVGAGDSFNAGFITAHIQGKSFEECIQFGVATSALKISNTTLPTLTEVVKMVQ